MQQILILIGITVGLSILSWLVQQMKSAADRRQMQRDRERQRAAAAERAPVERELVRDRRPPPTVAPVRRAEGSEVDRFMQEINRLRERAGAPPAARPVPPPAKPPAKPIPTVAPVRKKPRLSEQAAPDTFPATTGQVATGQSLAAPLPSRSKADELPMATVVGTAGRAAPAPVSPPPPVVTAAPKAKSVTVDRGTPMASPAGRQLLAMLKDKNSLAIAVLLQEVLGPPKAKRGPSI